MSDEEEVLPLPRKRRRVCPKIPYVFGETIVYGCERCMPVRDVHWVTWMCVGKRLGLSKDVARLIWDQLETPWTEWKTWEPVFNDVTLLIPETQVSLLSRFCCDIWDNCAQFEILRRTERVCYCKRESWDTMTGAHFVRERKDRSRFYVGCCVSSRYATVAIINKTMYYLYFANPKHAACFGVCKKDDITNKCFNHPLESLNYVNEEEYP